MSKELRADLHERFVDRLERVVPERLAELGEIVARHLELAALYRRELGLPDGDAAPRAAELLARAGERAYGRGDFSATRNLLERATALVAEGDPLRLRMLPRLGAVVFQQGEVDAALATLSAALDEAERGGRPRVRRRRQGGPRYGPGSDRPGVRLRAGRAGARSAAA
jgi:predicted ATPase